jgi:hypothetical protein
MGEQGFDEHVTSGTGAFGCTVEIGQRLTADDYLDHCHLLHAGGVKMAAAVAPAVERLTRRLGHGK